MLEKWRGNEVGGNRGERKKEVALVMCMELNRAGDAPRRGPAVGRASRRDRWGKEGGLVNIHILNCYFYSRIPPLRGTAS